MESWKQVFKDLKDKAQSLSSKFEFKVQVQSLNFTR